VRGCCGFRRAWRTQEYAVTIWNRQVQITDFALMNGRLDPRNGPNSGVLSFKESPADPETK